MTSAAHAEIAPGQGLLVEAVRDPGEPQVQVTVVLPCYNEVGHVEAEIVRITQGDGRQRLRLRALDVYDDMSTDGTRDLLAKLAAAAVPAHALPAASAATAARAPSAASAPRTPAARSSCGPTPT